MVFFFPVVVGNAERDAAATSPLVINVAAVPHAVTLPVDFDAATDASIATSASGGANASSSSSLLPALPATLPISIILNGQSDAGGGAPTEGGARFEFGDEPCAGERLLSRDDP